VIRLNAKFQRISHT